MGIVDRANELIETLDIDEFAKLEPKSLKEQLAVKLVKEAQSDFKVLQWLVEQVEGKSGVRKSVAQKSELVGLLEGLK